MLLMITYLLYPIGIQLKFYKLLPLLFPIVANAAYPTLKADPYILPAADLPTSCQLTTNGGLPIACELSPVTGGLQPVKDLTGIAVAPGTYVFKMQVTNGAGPSGYSAPFTLNFLGNVIPVPVISYSRATNAITTQPFTGLLPTSVEVSVDLLTNVPCVPSTTANGTVYVCPASANAKPHIASVVAKLIQNCNSTPGVGGTCNTAGQTTSASLTFNVVQSCLP